MANQALKKDILRYLADGKTHPFDEIYRQLDLLHEPPPIERWPRFKELVEAIRYEFLNWRVRTALKELLSDGKVHLEQGRSFTRSWLPFRIPVRFAHWRISVLGYRMIS